MNASDPAFPKHPETGTAHIGLTVRACIAMHIAGHVAIEALNQSMSREYFSDTVVDLADALIERLNRP